MRLEEVRMEDADHEALFLGKAASMPVKTCATDRHPVRRERHEQLLLESQRVQQLVVDRGSSEVATRCEVRDPDDGTRMRASCLMGDVGMLVHERVPGANVLWSQGVGRVHPGPRTVG